MPSILNLKFKGNKSFVAFSNLNDAESLTKTWKVCTKVASFLEQGQRLENLSWRLWHLQNLMVDTDNAKSKREFKKLSKCMSDKLDKEKGRSIEELEAPDFKRSSSSDMIRLRAEERERSREASQNAKPGTIKRMQFTFSVDHPTPVSNAPVQKPDLKPSPEFNKRPRAGVRNTVVEKSDDQMIIVEDEDKDPPLTHRGRKVPLSPSSSSGSSPSSSLSVSSASASSSTSNDSSSHCLKFPSLFSNDFGPSALLYPLPTLTTRMNYGEGLNPTSNQSDGFSIPRPTIELPLDDILNNVDSPRLWSPPPFPTSFSDARNNEEKDPLYIPMSTYHPHDVVMQTVPISTLSAASFNDTSSENDNDSSNDSDDEASDDVDLMSTTTLSNVPPIAQQQPTPMAAPPRPLSPPAPSTTPTPAFTTGKATGRPPKAVTSSKGNTSFSATYSGSTLGSSARGRRNTVGGRPQLTVRTQSTRSATVTSLNRGVGSTIPTASAMNNTGPGGVKAECSNCGATHTPLWRRGLNDELNCNACGLYCKLHKRPRPKTMRNSHGEGRSQTAPRQETVDVVAQCYNCHTTATPLWRKDDEGKTVCNACGLYYKLHGSARPISMKSDVIRKRSRHDARRTANGGIMAETPSASPGVSRRASPSRESSPTLAPDSSTSTNQYDYSSANDEFEFRPSTSELMNALGNEFSQNTLSGTSNASNANGVTGVYGGNLMETFQFPGPYNPDHLQQYVNPMDPLPFANGGGEYERDYGNNDGDMSPRTNKRRRMSVDSASEPPSSAVSYSSYNDGYSSATSATSHSQRSSIDFPFSTYPSVGAYQTSAGPVFRGTTNPFWHPPMMVGAGQKESPMYHPPMLPPSEESPMDYLHPPLLPHDEEALFSAYLHPPMSLPEKNGNHGNENRRDSDQNSSGQSDAGNNEMQMQQDSSHDISHLVSYGDYMMSDAMQMYFKDN